MRHTNLCAFCDIASGALPAAVVFADEQVMAILDFRPLFPGHCLLIPRQHFETLPDTPPGLAATLMTRTQLLARAVEQATAADGTMLVVNNRVSQSVPHVHIHVIPRRRGDGLHGFFYPRQQYESAAAMEEMRSAIAAAVEQIHDDQMHDDL
jgi:histidine triad (HIT) family protein